MEAELANTNAPKLESTSLSISMRAQTEYLLQNAVLMTEMVIDLKEKCLAGQKHISYLRSIIGFLILAQELVQTITNGIDALVLTEPACSSLKSEFEKLLSIIDKELVNVEGGETTNAPTSSCCSPVNMAMITDKIKQLEIKQKLSDNLLLPSSSTKSVKSDIDEKYPENLSRESLIDLNTVINLPTVPEDIFTCFTNNKPKRTSSLSSLKSMRKVKFFLQRASNASDEEDENSEPEDHDFNKMMASI
ncbi:hypothetical protein FQA39_LY08625 [Lamprigera yunnana]|nr:hypothetical protein FQA39_LY08625 [Lamprigera yunnana]